MIDELYLCAVNHFDPDGPERLMRALRIVSPDVITVESLEEDVEAALKLREKSQKFTDQELINDYTAAVLKQEGDNISSAIEADLKRLNPEILRIYYATIAYEVTVATEYCKQNDCKLVFAEDRDIDKNIGEARFASLLMVLTKESINELRLGVQTFYDMINSNHPGDPSRHMRTTDRNYSKTFFIRKQHGVVFDIGGAGHYFGNYDKTLPDLLSRYKPTTFTLDKI